MRSSCLLRRVPPFDLAQWWAVLAPIGRLFSSEGFARVPARHLELQGAAARGDGDTGRNRRRDGRGKLVTFPLPLARYSILTTGVFRDELMRSPPVWIAMLVDLTARCCSFASARSLGGSSFLLGKYGATGTRPIPMS